MIKGPMLEPPPIANQTLEERLRLDYGLDGARVAFLPLGADGDSAVYRVEAPEGVFFLKLRRGFDGLGVDVPRWLRAQGLRQIIPVIETRAGASTARLDEWTLILAPFVEGQDGYHRGLSGDQWQEFGAALARVHGTLLPPELAARIPRVQFDGRWRNLLREMLRLAQTGPYADAYAGELAAGLERYSGQVQRLLAQAERLAERMNARWGGAADDDSAHSQNGMTPSPEGKLQPGLRSASGVEQAGPKPVSGGAALAPVLCHTDLHPGNLHITRSDFFIVDWDAPLLAPKEQDLLFFGAGMGFDDPAALERFWQGYGPVEIDAHALAYFRAERVITDLAIYSHDLLVGGAVGADRPQALREVLSNFLPNSTIERAITGIKEDSA